MLRSNAGVRRIPPVFVALGAQLCAALALWYALSAGAMPQSLMSEQSSGAMRLLWLALLQGALASGASFALGQRTWWLPIQFAFWPAVLAALALGVPPWVYLGAFVLALLVYWNTYRTQVPLFLSGRGVWTALEALLPQRAPFQFIDIGCGFGGVLHYLSAARAQGGFSGVELAPLPWAVAWARGRLAGRCYRVLRQDYRAIDLGEFDFVFCFLSPAAMPALWDQAQRQMRKGSALISCEFPVPGQRASATLQAQGGRLLYVYRMR